MLNKVEVSPTIFKSYAVVVGGKYEIAEYREWVYDVKQPNWSIDGVTHWIELPPIENLD